MIRYLRWLITLSGSKQDVERLAGESLPGLSTNEAAPRELLLELHDPEGDATGDDAPRAAKAVIDASVRHVNAFGRLRWGRAFESVAVSEIKSFDPAGRATHQLFFEPATAFLLPEEYADMIERLGHPRPELPAGVEVVNALEGAALTALGETNPEVGRVLHLVDLMLRGDGEIDWVAGYAALEVIEQDLHKRKIDGRALGWWTKAEHTNFTATANSAEALGVHARHGTGGVTTARMTSKEASWLVRRIAAHWLTHLLADSDGESDCS